MLNQKSPPDGATHTEHQFAEELADALEDANLPTLLLSLAQLTGDPKWLRDPYRPAKAKGPGDNDSGGFTDELQAEIRAEAWGLICRWEAGQLEPAPTPTPDVLAEMLGISLSERLPSGYGVLLAEEMGLAQRHVTIPTPPATDPLGVLVIGAGISGLLAAIELQRSGVEFLVVEKDATLGGTWYENIYPGAGVDTPTHLYSLSFAQRADWKDYFSKRGQLFDYLEGLAHEYGLREHVRFGLEVTQAVWDEDGQRWQVTAVDAGGCIHEFCPNVLITGVGYFNRPAFPSIPGLDTFKGPVMHTAQWRPEVEIEDKQVAVIGTGASAMQLVPTIAGVAARVVVFQRTAQWGLPHPNYLREVSAGTKWLMRNVPFYQGWYRAQLVWTFGDRLHSHVQWDPDWVDSSELSISALNDRTRQFLSEYIRAELGDQADELFEKCLPNYPPYGKRPLLDNGWFRTVARDDVDLITEDIVEVTESAIRTADGACLAVDVIVLATGFQAQRMLAPMEIRGRSGASLRDVWGEDDPRAYLGITVPDFPNMFCLLGPNTFAGHGGSGILTIELEMRYVMEMLAHMSREAISSVECRQDVHDSYNDELAAALARTIWAHPGMSTYYRNGAGRIVVPMPWTNVDYWHRTRVPDMGDYIVKRR